MRVYTDDKEALKGRIARSGQRGSATELLAGKLRADAKPLGMTDMRQRTRDRQRRQWWYARRRDIILGDIRDRLTRGAERVKDLWQERVQHAGRGMER